MICRLESTSVTALELGRIAEETRIPPGVINVVPGYGQDRRCASGFSSRRE